MNKWRRAGVWDEWCILQVSDGEAVATGPAPDGSSYFVLAYLSDDDDSNTSAAVNSQPAAVQQPADRWS